MSHPSKDDFEQTLQIAEFASQRLENRRQFEFKIFISYMTLLVLAIYEGHHIKVPNDEALYGWCVLGLLIVMHYFYISWTISLSVAMRNDSERKNFYLQKAEYISASLLKKFGNPLCRKMNNEYCRLCPDEMKVKIVPKGLCVLKHLDEIWINWATPFQVVLPTIIFSLLVFNLFKELRAGWVGLVVLWGPLLLIIIASTIVYYIKKSSKTRRAKKSV